MPAARTVILLGCVKTKLDRPAPAKDLYCSTLWKRRRAYAETSGEPWFILSAKHGLVDPEQQLAPYDLGLGDLSPDDRREWGERVVSALERRHGTLEDISFEIHAGALYRDAITRLILERGGNVSAPLAHLPQGRQPGWYDARMSLSPETSAPRRRTSTSGELQQALAALAGAPIRVRARDWPGDLEGIDQPGMYSWWVDRAGAVDLSGGLGERVDAGRIYAGQTGATKWPSGKVGKATLRSRIGGNHLNGRIRGSTFRFTLAAALGEPLGLVRTGPQQLDTGSEGRLSEWMRDHLEVAVHPFPEPDVLGDLEHRVLALAYASAQHRWDAVDVVTADALGAARCPRTQLGTRSLIARNRVPMPGSRRI
jgi:hypothetical protein